MEVYCEFCKKGRNPDDCWCVIDIPKKIRYFECKIKCQPPTPLQHQEPTAASTTHSMEPFELDIIDDEDDDDDDPSEIVLVEDWIVQPQRTWIQWLKSIVGLQSYRYMKVKTR
jgi:hypothetical protein